MTPWTTPLFAAIITLNGARRAVDDNDSPAMLMASPLCSYRQDPGGSKDPQTGGAGTGSLCQRHRPGADRGQALQPRGQHTEGIQQSHPIYIMLHPPIKSVSRSDPIKFLLLFSLSI